MEDPEAEWENHKEYDDGWNRSGQVDWVLDKVLRLGKRILVAGFVITSAPIVLPPLVVISAIGFVCSVPYSFFLASYACTEKLMSKLLSCPSTTAGSAPLSSLLLGYGCDDDGGRIHEQRGFDRGEKRLVGGPDFDVEENAYMEDVGEDMEGEGEKPSEGIEMEIGVGEGEGKKVGTEVIISGVDDDALGVMITMEDDEKLGGYVKEETVPFEVTGVAVDLCEGRVSNKDNEMVKETRGLVEKMRDEGIGDTGAMEEKQVGPKEGSKEVGGTASKIERTKGDKNALGTVGAEPGVPMMEHQVEQKGKETRGNLEEKDVDLESSEEKKSRKANKSREGKVKGEKDVQPKKEKEGASEVSNRSATGLSDSKNSAGLKHSKTASGGQEGRVLSNYAVHKIADPLKITVSPGGHDVELTEKSFGEPIGAASSEVLYSEEQIWKQIDAARKILGYTVPHHATSVEELKALYIFAGVELPTSFYDPFDLVEVNDKLKFLMSIIGGK